MSIECRQSELPALREQLGNWLDEVRVPEGPAFHAKLVTHEAAKNAIAHAGPGDQVKVRATLEEDDIVIEVLDTNGEPWELDGSESAELRGVTLIHGLARHVETVHQDGGTALVMLVESRPRRSGSA
jgi:anti-sigma regulatory factor (Ser/Thr protein kinase)